MPDENKSLDLLGIKSLSESVKIATERCLDGAAAFLSRVCLPALEEFGLALRDRVSAWRARNATKMLSTANELLNTEQPGTEQQVHPRLIHVAIEEGSWTDDEVVQRMWAGLLASATSPDGSSDENLIFLNILRQLSSLQVRIVAFAVGRAKKYDAGHALPFAEFVAINAKELASAVGCDDVQRLDRELDHLREIGLIVGGFRLGTDEAELTPTALALHLYVRAHGSKKSPVEYWELKPLGDGTA